MAGGRCRSRSKTQGKGCMKRVEHRLRCGSSLECGEHGIHSEIFCKSFATLSLEVTNDLPSSCAQRKFVLLGAAYCGLRVYGFVVRYTQPHSGNILSWRRHRISFPSTPGISRAMPADDLLNQCLAESLRQWARAQ